jgi:hypothetical protein
MVAVRAFALILNTTTVFGARENCRMLRAGHGRLVRRRAGCWRIRNSARLFR